MIPQRFIMMKCIRIIFLLHVVGIVFFAYTLYNSVGSQSPPSDVSSRDVVSWTAGDNSSASYNGLVEGNGGEVKDDEFSVVTDDGKSTQDESVDEELEIDRLQNNDNNVNGQDNTDGNYDGDENNQDDDYETEDEDKIQDESKAPNYDISPKSVKTGRQDVMFKTEQSQLGPLPAAVVRNSHWTLSSAGKYSKSIYSPPPNERAIQRLPQALVIGSPSSGIRPLIDFLEIHPQIVPLKREIPFLDNQNRLQIYSNAFLSQMPLSYSNQVTVGRTHFSHWTKKAVCDLYTRKKSMKIIVVLRDPVSRILSQATNSNIGGTGRLVVAQHGETLKINNDTQAVEWGRYVEYLKMWTECFPKSQLHIVEWSDIMQRPAQTVRKIEGFLGVPHRVNEDNFYRDETRRVYCVRPFHLKGKVCLAEKKGKSPTLSPEGEALIYRFYSKHNEELFKLLGQRYQWEPKGA